MARHNRLDPARLDRIERRLQALEDSEAIRNLKARYAALCDRQYDAEGIAALFTADAVGESPGLGRFEGREAIRNFFRGGRPAASMRADGSKRPDACRGPQFSTPAVDRAQGKLHAR